MSQRRIRPFSNDEDECGDDGPQSVGGGCADFTPHEDTRGNLNHAVKMVGRLFKLGATYVKIGDIEVVHRDHMAKPEGVSE